MTERVEGKLQCRKPDFSRRLRPALQRTEGTRDWERGKEGKRGLGHSLTGMGSHPGLLLVVPPLSSGSIAGSTADAGRRGTPSEGPTKFGMPLWGGPTPVTVTPVAVGGGKSATWQRGRDDKAVSEWQGEQGYRGGGEGVR